MQTTVPNQPPYQTRHMTIFINDVRFEAPARVLTGAEIKRLGGVPAGNRLYREEPGAHPDTPIPDDTSVELKSGEKFYDLPPGTVGAGLLPSIEAQIARLREDFAQVDVRTHPDGTTHVVVGPVRLDQTWSKTKSRVLVVLPLGYPEVRPSGFFADPDIGLVAAGGEPAGSGHQQVAGEQWRAFCEAAAVLQAGIGRTARSVRLLVREVVPVPDAAFLRKGRAGLTIDPDFLAPLVKRCREEGWAFMLVHSHPFSCEDVRFSTIDDGGERALFPRIQTRVPGLPVGAMVFGQASLDARLWLAGEAAGRPIDRVVVVGTDRFTLLSPTGAARRSRTAATVSGATGRQARQVLALGAASREILRDLHVAVVGAGGLGSLVYQQLVHLGIGRVDVIDPDILEASNLSRVVWSTPADVGRPKVDVLADVARRVAPGLVTEAIRGDA